MYKRQVFAITSDDGGDSWAWGSVADDSLSAGNGNEVQVVELADGSLLLNSRSAGGNLVRKVALSADGGQSWSPLVDEDELIEPQVMASTLSYTDPLDGFQSRILYSGPHSQKWRVNGRVHLSYDGGSSWPVSKLVYGGPFAYSVLTVIDDATLGVLFERDGTDHISLARFDLEWLTDGADCLLPDSFFTSYGSGCPGSGGLVPSLNLTGCATPGGVFEVSLAGGLGGSAAYLAVGLQQAALPLGAGCELLVAPLLAVAGPFALSGAGPGTGTFALSVPLPASTALTGFTLQAFAVDAGAAAGFFSSSNGVAASVP